MSELPRIFKSGEVLWLLFEDNGHQHSCNLPLYDKEGKLQVKSFEILIDILNERERGPLKSPASQYLEGHDIASGGAPIQHMIDQWLKGNSPTKVGKKQGVTLETSLEDLGL